MNNLKLILNFLLSLDNIPNVTALSPEAKMVWIKLLLYSNTSSFELKSTTKEIRLSLGLSQSTLSKAIEELEHGELLVRRDRKTPKGSHSYHYKVTPPIDRVNNIDKSSPFCKLAPQIISGTNLPSKINLANRLVLLLLIHHSNDFGYVDTLSRKKIGRLAGMSPVRVRSHQKKLYNFGFLDLVINGSVMNGMAKKICSQYYLNLWHPAFTQRVQCTHLWAIDSIKDLYHFEIDVINGLKNSKKRSAYNLAMNVSFDHAGIKSTQIESSDTKLAQFLSNYSPVHLATKTDHLANHLLNNHRQELSAIGNELDSLPIPLDSNLIFRALIESEHFFPEVFKYSEIAERASNKQRQLESHWASEALGYEVSLDEEVNNKGKKNNPLLLAIAYISWAKAAEAYKFIEQHFGAPIEQPWRYSIRPRTMTDGILGYYVIGIPFSDSVLTEEPIKESLIICGEETIQFDQPRPVNYFSIMALQ